MVTHNPSMKWINHHVAIANPHGTTEIGSKTSFYFAGNVNLQATL